MGTIVDLGAGRVPYQTPDDTRSWIESIRTIQKGTGRGDLLRPSLMLRFATDSNYIRSQKMTLYNSHPMDVQTKAIMNTAICGQRIPGILNWQVNEATDQVTSTASFECLNALPISQVETTTTSALPKRHHHPQIKSTFVADSLYVVRRVDGTTNVEYITDPQGYLYREEHVKYRIFEHDIVATADASDFPDPSIPDDDDNDIPDDEEYIFGPSTASGSYFVLMGNEVIRVIGKFANTFIIPPGGRGVNGIIEDHAIGTKVQLLGYGPYTGSWSALGYLNTDDYKPQKSILRPGNCLVSYEGWGPMVSPMRHNYSPLSNTHFTGYWFISGTEPSVGEDGVPRVRVDLKGPGYMYEAQKTSPDMLQRVKNQFGQWMVGQREAGQHGATIWNAADHNRDIPGDWVDFNSWDPSLPGSYPLQIKTEFAQHKEFFDHMQETELGLRCDICRQEHADWLKTHEKDPKRAIQEAKSVGKHIYKQSIRVMNDVEGAGPIKTFIRLMSTIAAAAWDHPAYGTEASYRFTKIPNKLYDNIRNVHTGLVYNGQPALATEQTTPGFSWDNPTYDDTKVIMGRHELTCPFEGTYDKAPFSQPMIDLAEVNDAQFWVHRRGYPVFVPRLWPFRPPNFIGQDWPTANIGWRNLAKTDPWYPENHEWFMSYGASITGYSHSVDASEVLTQCWVSATTAFESTFTIASGGTGFTQTEGEYNAQRVNYSPLGGNKEGLALTGGVQQVDTISLDNQRLGLDWNTNPANWGIEYRTKDGYMEVEGKPPLYDGSPPISKGTDRHGATERVQRTINFFLERRYMNGYRMPDGTWIYSLAVDGKFGNKTEEGVKALQRFLGQSATGTYNRNTYNAIVFTLTATKYFLKRDPWWYVLNNRNWQEYVAAVTGVPVPMKAGSQEIKGSTKKDLETPKWVIDDKGLQKEIDKWQRNFAKDAIAVGNRKVDDSINKATVRTIQSNLADPRVQPADVIWVEIPGYLGARTGTGGRNRPPYTNGIFVNQISRQMDLTSGTYTATYSGYRYRGEIGYGISRGTSRGYDFLK